MIRTDLQAAVDLVSAVCDALDGLPVDAASLEAANLRRATGALAADAEALVGSGRYPASMAACFGLAQASGATFDGLWRLWQRVSGLGADGAYARILRQDALRRAIIGMARCLADMEFGNRDAVDAAQAQINTVFAAAEEDAADALDAETYRALVTLHASVTRDLSVRAQPLPRIVPYTLAVPLPALVLAQRLYGDAARTDELLAANPARNPLFMPRSGRALSS